MERNATSEDLGGTYVDVYDFPDGRLEVRSRGLVLPYRVFSKDKRVSHIAIVENKRLGHTLALIKAQQDSHFETKVKTNSKKGKYQKRSECPTRCLHSLHCVQTARRYRLPLGVLYFNIIPERGDMHTTNLRKVGGSIMLAVPPAILDLLHLEVGAIVGLEVDGERLVIDPKVKPRYTLAELLDASDYSQPQPPEEREWIDAPSVGGELL
jgi:antitoxin ChpS